MRVVCLLLHDGAARFVGLFDDFKLLLWGPAPAALNEESIPLAAIGCSARFNSKIRPINLYLRLFF